LKDTLLPTHGSDYTPYEDIEVTGWPVLTMARSKTVMRGGVLVGAPRHGVHLKRSTFRDPAA
jgi:dihydropyrimidinase